MLFVPAEIPLLVLIDELLLLLILSKPADTAIPLNYCWLLVSPRLIIGILPPTDNVAFLFGV